ncbi:hypothetical protein HDE68_004186 [Pedobacter cryoconitis]|uniref:Uncharacterized protein n=1 Tax=Pedobacter cryoconitis TaxID=188932 RepID=A0A7W9E0C5_9SPHI|nr:hypothetical protein [Pedobacter cryoconitis]MBB5638257.1 hypothetical protein [Pedobacter cryoconitis]
MGRIFYTASSYTAPYDNINQLVETPLICSKLDLYRCIMTVGNPSYITKIDIRNYGLWRALSNSIIQKCLIVFTNIQSGEDLNLHPIYNDYVSDQKRIVSYNLGMAVAKYYAEKLLSIPNLIHVESLKKQGAITFVDTTSKLEPDLVGVSENGEWHVFEAKGTTAKHLNSKIKEAKDQGGNVDTIHGLVPSTITACATSFGKDRIFSKIVDPPSQKGVKKIVIDPEKFYETYYSPYFALEEFNSPRGKTSRLRGEDFRMLNLKANNLDIEVGLDVEIYELLVDRKFDDIEQFYIRNQSSVIDRQIDSENNRISRGLDGFIVQYGG